MSAGRRRKQKVTILGISATARSLRSCKNTWFVATTTKGKSSKNGEVLHERLQLQWRTSSLWPFRSVAPLQLVFHFQSMRKASTYYVTDIRYGWLSNIVRGAQNEISAIKSMKPISLYFLWVGDRSSLKQKYLPAKLVVNILLRTWSFPQDQSSLTTKKLLRDAHGKNPRFLLAKIFNVLVPKQQQRRIVPRISPSMDNLERVKYGNASRRAARKELIESTKMLKCTTEACFRPIAQLLHLKNWYGNTATKRYSISKANVQPSH